MSMLDPFNPRPGPTPEGRRHQQPYDVAQEGGKGFVWVPVAVLGVVGLIILIAAF